MCFPLVLVLLPLLLTSSSSLSLSKDKEVLIKVMKQLNNNSAVSFHHGFSKEQKVRLTQMINHQGYFISVNDKKDSFHIGIITELISFSMLNISKGLFLQESLELRPIVSKVHQEVYVLHLEEIQSLFESYRIEDSYMTTKLTSIKNGTFLGRIPSKLRRRADFKGIQFRALAYDAIRNATDPFEITEVLDHYEPYAPYLRTMEKILNFSTRIYIHPYLPGGTVTFKNGSIKTNGMIKTIIDEDFDLIVSEMSMLSERTFAIDYLQVMTASKVAFFVVKEDLTEELDWTPLINPFEIHVWITIGSMTILISISWVVLNRNSNVIETIPKVFLLHFGGRFSGWQNSSQATFIITVLLMGTIIWSYYRCQLTSEFSIRIQSNPFNTIEDLSKSNYKILTTPEGNPTSKIIQNASHNSEFYPLVSKDIEFLSWTGLIQRTKNLSKEIKETIFCDKNYILDNLHPKDCNVFIAWESRTSLVYMSMILRKHSAYREFLNYQVIRMMEIGLFRRSIKQRLCNDQNWSEITAPSWKKMVSLFCILFIGFALSLHCFLLELLQPKWLDQYYNKVPKSLDDFDSIKSKLKLLKSYSVGNESNETLIEDCLYLVEKIRVGTDYSLYTKEEIQTVQNQQRSF